MLRVELDADEDFVRKSYELEPEKIAHGSGAGEALSAGQLLGEAPRRKLHGCLQLDEWIIPVGAGMLGTEKIAVLLRL